VNQADAQALVGASSFVFSLDDLQGSWEPHMWADLLQFLQNPSSRNVAHDEGDHGLAGDDRPRSLVASSASRPVWAQNHEPGRPLAHVVVRTDRSIRPPSLSTQERAATINASVA